MIEHATDWRMAGACLTADPDLFFPIAVGTVASKEIARAQRICAGCPVRQQCLDFAMRTREPTGIWGGTTPDERIRALRARHQRPAYRPAHELTETRASLSPGRAYPRVTAADAAPQGGRSGRVRRRWR